jgi:hypothetical protein
MNWKDFKEMVEQHVKDEDEIEYIDCHPLDGANFKLLETTRPDHNVWAIWT